MSAEQFVAVLVAITGLVAAIGALYTEVRATRSAVNGRLTELVESTRLAATALAELKARDAVGNSPTQIGDSPDS